LFYKRRKHKLKAREVSDQLVFESLLDLRSLFVDPSSDLMAALWLTDAYKPFSFTNIARKPRDLPTSFKHMPTFSGNRAKGVKVFLDKFIKTMRFLRVGHLDVLFKCFAIALTGDVVRWFESLPDNSIDKIDGLCNIIFNRWAEKKDVRFLLNALTGIKRKENETIDAFNVIFDEVV
jgi:hypothetical protein